MPSNTFAASPAAFTPSPASHNHSHHDTSFNSFLLNQSLFSSPPPNSVASAREEFRRSSHAVDHPFTRLMACGGVEGGTSVPIFDSHCHLDFLFDKLAFRGSLERFIQDNAEYTSPNFAGLIANFCEPKNANDINFKKVKPVRNEIFNFF